MRTVDFSPFSRSSIGFERLFDLLEGSMRVEQNGNNYPPYNIERVGEDAYRIELAVAGFGPEDLTITAQQNVLTVTGRKSASENGQYLYQGLAGRSFERQFHLADYIKVTDAELENGLLRINLAREVPESMKPRRIEIGKAGAQPKVIDQKAA